MGVQISGIIPRKKIRLQALNGKSIAIDAYNSLYQFLSIIRSFDGRPLMDKAGNVTSHLSGLLYRTTNFLDIGIKPVYVFDGKPPTLKHKEITRRKEVKKTATKQYEAALRAGKFEEAKMYAQATAQLKDSMVQDAKTLLTLLGVPWVQAPSEGEAQTAYMASSGSVWAAASQDYDSLLFGATRLLRNIAISGRRKLPRKNVYIEVEPEIVELDHVLHALGISRDQLIILGILVGTDFNPNGIKGVGPKTALKLVKKYGTLEDVTQQFDKAVFRVDPTEIQDIFLQPNITTNYSLSWKSPNSAGVLSFLCDQRDFSENRVQKALNKSVDAFKKQQKSTLEQWF